MATIGTLAVNVVANTEKFSRNMKGARNDLRLFGVSVKSINMAMRSFGLAFSAGFALRTIREAISDMDDLADTAARLGTSVEALSRLQYAGFMSDVSSGELSRAMTFMEKSVANNAKAFASLGLSVYRLRQLDAVEMFVQIADAINRLPTAAERTAAAMGIFGRGGAGMMELISKGRSGIAGLMGETPFPITNESLQNIEKGDKAIKRLIATFESLKRVMALEVVEEVIDFSTGLQQVGDRIKNFDRRAQKFVDDTAVSLGLQSPLNTREFRESIQGKIDASKERAAAWRRSISESQAIIKEVERLANISPGVPIKQNPFGLGALSVPLGMRALIDAFERNERFRLGELSMATQSRIGTAIGSMDIAGNAPEFRRRRMDTEVRGLSALEKGTAAAFSQEKRSQQANQMLDIGRKQLEQQKQMKDALNRIDTNLKTFEGTVPSNLS